MAGKPSPTRVLSSLKTGKNIGKKGGLLKVLVAMVLVTFQSPLIFRGVDVFVLLPYTVSSQERKRSIWNHICALYVNLTAFLLASIWVGNTSKRCFS